MTEVTTEEPRVKTREEIAMEKVTDPFAKPYPYVHEVPYDPKKLRDILREGIIAGDFAERIHKEDYKSRWDYPVNLRHVSLTRDIPALYLEFGEISFLVDPSKVQLVSPDVVRPSGYNEVLVRNRISSRKLTGIVVGTREGELFLNARKLPNSIVGDVEGILESIDPKYALPVYSNGGLVWPREMSREELQEYVQSKQKVVGFVK